MFSVMGSICRLTIREGFILAKPRPLWPLLLQETWDLVKIIKKLMATFPNWCSFLEALCGPWKLRMKLWSSLLNGW